MHYELWIVLWRSGYRRRAFRSIFARYVPVSLPRFDLGTSTGSVTSFRPRPQNPFSKLAKDAASIPNALEAANSKSRASNNNSDLDA